MISAGVPSGPLRETRAPPEVASAIGADEFGLLLRVARNIGVAELGIEVLVVAASALVEKGQNALTRFGRSIAPETMAASESMKKCWLNLMGNKGVRWVGLNTKMAYISHFLSTSIAVTAGSIAP